MCNNQKTNKITSSHQLKDWGSKGAAWRHRLVQKAGSPQSLALPPSWLPPWCWKKLLLWSTEPASLFHPPRNNKQTKLGFSGRKPGAHLDLIAFRCLGPDVRNLKDADNSLNACISAIRCSTIGKKSYPYIAGCRWRGIVYPKWHACCHAV